MPFSPIPRITINFLGFPNAYTTNSTPLPAAPSRRIILDLPDSQSRVNTIHDLLNHVKQDPTLVSDVFVDMSKAVVYNSDYVPLARSAPVGILRDGDIVIVCWNGGAMPMNSSSTDISGKHQQSQSYELSDPKQRNTIQKKPASTERLDDEDDFYNSDKHSSIPSKPVDQTSGGRSRSAAVQQDSAKQAVKSSSKQQSPIVQQRDVYNDDAPAPSRKTGAQKGEKSAISKQLRDFEASSSSLSLSSEEHGWNSHKTTSAPLKDDTWNSQHKSSSSAVPIKDDWNAEQRKTSTGTKQQDHRSGSAYEADPFDEYDQQPPRAASPSSKSPVSKGYGDDIIYGSKPSKGYTEEIAPIHSSSKAKGHEETYATKSSKSYDDSEKINKSYMDSVLAKGQYPSPEKKEVVKSYSSSTKSSSVEDRHTHQSRNEETKQSRPLVDDRITQVSRKDAPPNRSASEMDKKMIAKPISNSQARQGSGGIGGSIPIGDVRGTTSISGSSRPVSPQKSTFAAGSSGSRREEY